MISGFNKTSRKISKEIKERLDRLKIKPDQIELIHTQIRHLTRQFETPGPNMKQITDFSVSHQSHQVPVRLYTPYQIPSRISPCLIYLHGGGFVTCSLDSHDGLCRRLASGSGYQVLSVDYRLAPAHPYPAAPQDCETVLQWALSGQGTDRYIDPHKLAIGGDSAGGNMSAYLAQAYRQHLKAQILFYPLMQLVELTPPKIAPQDWVPLGVMALKFIEEHYVAGADPCISRLSPLLETELRGLPPSYILTCGLDPLRDEGHAYSEKLIALGNIVQYHHEKNLPHGFLTFTGLFHKKGHKIPLDAADFLHQNMR